MNFSVAYGNETISVAHIQALTSLISIMSSHFLIRSFTVVSDLELPSILNLQKMASSYYFETRFVNLMVNNGPGDSEKGYIIFQKSRFDLLKVIENKPKLIVLIFITDQINPKPSDFIPEIVIPPSTSFFLVLMSKHPEGVPSSKNSIPVQGKCFRLYKPASNFTLRTFPLMLYNGPEENKWNWQGERTDWNSYEKDVLNMSEITVTVALATSREKNSALRAFAKSRSSFFWKTMAEFLKFRIVMHVTYIPPEAVKSMTTVYLKLLMTVADGLGILPVMSSERNHQSLRFIITGIDSRYQLLVKAPEYVYSWLSTLKPFALDSWFCLGLTILLISFALKIVSHGERSDDTNASGCFLMIFGFICSQGSPNIPKDPSARLVCYIALLFSIIIYQFYTSNFCSLLSTKEVSLPFTSLEQLIAMRTHSLFVHPDTAIYAHILTAESGLFKKLHDEILKKDPSHKLSTVNRKKNLDKVCKGTGAVLSLPYQILGVNELSCRLIPVNNGYFPTSIGTAIRKSFPFRSQFEFVHLRLLEAGLTHKFKDDFLNVNQQHATKADVTNDPVSLKHVAFLFAFYAASIVLSFLIFCFEVVFFSSFRKTNNSRKLIRLKKKKFHRVEHP